MTRSRFLTAKVALAAARPIFYSVYKYGSDLKLNFHCRQKKLCAVEIALSQFHVKRNSETLGSGI